jgi:hypothetical protein
MNARAPCTSGPECPSLHTQGPEACFLCQPPLAPHRWAPWSAATTGGRAGHRCRGAPELCPPPKFSLLPFGSNTGEHMYAIPSISSSHSWPHPCPSLPESPAPPTPGAPFRSPCVPVRLCTEVGEDPCFVFRTIGFSVIFRYVFVS